MHLQRQPADAVIDVCDWQADEKYPIFPTGSKPKRALLCPDKEDRPCLRPGHRYLFKSAAGWQQQQLWSEVIAYELSRVLNLDVPPALVAIDSSTGTAGVLVEFFYGYPGVTETSRLVHAADLMQDHFVEGKKGRPHALRENLALCRLVGAPSSREWWAKALFFDTLIGNTDRHSENWGFLRTWHGGKTTMHLAPLYDNGTSLGYNIPDAKLDPAWDGARMNRFVLRGTHDCGWSREEDGPIGHIALAERYVATFPSVRAEAERLLSLGDADVEDVTAWCESFTLPVVFSSSRSEFIVRQVATRRDLLTEAIGL